MDSKEIIQAIISGNFSNEELSSMGEAIRFARNQLGKQVKSSIRVGDKVEFKDTRIGYVHQGSVTKINVKYVIVNTNKGNYRVPANMLTVV